MPPFKPTFPSPETLNLVPVSTPAGILILNFFLTCFTPLPPQLTHGSANTTEVFWYEDPSTVGAPTISFSGVTTPLSSSHVVAYSSGVPHYTNNAANTYITPIK